VDHPPNEDQDDPQALWPERILRLGNRLRTAPPATRPALVGALWGILNIVLQRYARLQASHLGRLGTEDIRDVAASKASDLVARLDLRAWDPAASSPSQIRAFLRATARNGVVDALRSGRREVLMGDDLEPLGGSGVEIASQHDAVESGEFVRALLGCVSTLTARSRKAWFLRVFCDFDSGEIARHPEVASSPAGVDAMLARCREHMRACMEKRGVAMRRLPPGTFVRLWELTEGERIALGVDP
jgi:DNA-directed RNA polymerase specialized sigma24 family protein